MTYGAAEQLAEKPGFRRTAPKGASQFKELTASLKRCPDTKLGFSAICEAAPLQSKVKNLSFSAASEVGPFPCMCRPAQTQLRFPRLPADHADLDLEVAGKAVFEGVIGDHASRIRGKLALCASA